MPELSHILFPVTVTVTVMVPATVTVTVPFTVTVTVTVAVGGVAAVGCGVDRLGRSGLAERGVTAETADP
ncbi:hypothetical protein [Streptomyces sp. NPDC014995]|uniref:hypothetical protein n=1 Tax=Streptomyces sp. NPDC014995 TaxID=3364936 RepID=UPI0036FE3B15